MYPVQFVILGCVLQELDGADWTNTTDHPRLVFMIFFHISVNCPVFATVIFEMLVFKLDKAGLLLYMFCTFVIMVVMPVESVGRFVPVKTVVQVLVARAE